MPPRSRLLDMLGLAPRELMRKGGPSTRRAAQTIRSQPRAADRADGPHPKLIERPIVVSGDKAVIRPTAGTRAGDPVSSTTSWSCTTSRHGATADMARLVARGVEEGGLQARLRTGTGAGSADHEAPPVPCRAVPRTRRIADLGRCAALALAA